MTHQTSNISTCEFGIGLWSTSSKCVRSSTGKSSVSPLAMTPQFPVWLKGPRQTFPAQKEETDTDHLEISAERSNDRSGSIQVKWHLFTGRGRLFDFPAVATGWGSISRLKLTELDIIRRPQIEPQWLSTNRTPGKSAEKLGSRKFYRQLMA